MNRMPIVHQNSGAIGRFTHSRCPSHFISQLLRLVLASPCASFKIKGEERKWLIALIIRNISQFRFCNKESNHPFSPFSKVSTFSSFSLLLSFSLPPASHKNHNMIILKPRCPVGGRHFVGGPSELRPLDFVFHAL